VLVYVFNALFLFISICPGATITNPRLDPVTIGRETATFRWSGDAYSEGAYNEDGSYTLSGNGQGVYWCWDGCAAAMVNEFPLTGDFTFTARLRSADIPEGGVRQIGVLVKGYMLTAANVLSLRWDTYWATRGSGLTWFNRITPLSEMAEFDAAPSEKSCSGTGQGCFGMGYENVVEGFENPENIWMRISRVVEGTNSKYYLYVRGSSSEPWRQVDAVTSTHNPCGATQTPFSEPMNMGHFRIPDDRNDEVFVGLFVADGTHGSALVSATFDSISIEASNSDEPFPEPQSDEYPADCKWWPTYLGPFGAFSTTDNGNVLVDRLHDSRLVWESEYTPPAKSQSARYGCNNHQRATGGGASPIVYNGKVFQYYYLPDPSTYDTELVGKNSNCENPDSLKKLFAKTAWDVVACFDAVDGHTVWKKKLNKGPYHYDAKGILGNQTPCAAYGNVYVAGCGGMWYCLDAETGELQWKKSGGVPGSSALIFADSVIVSGIGARGRTDGVADMVGVDAMTGERLWYLRDISPGIGLPSWWTHNNEEFIIAASGDSVLTCVIPRTGEVLWEQEIGFQKWVAPVYKDYVVVNIGGPLNDGGSWDQGQAGCFKLSPTGAEKVWELDKKYGYAKEQNATIYKDRLYLHLSPIDSFLVIDIQNGDIINSFYTGGKPPFSSIVIAGDNRLFTEDNAGHKPSQMWMLDIAGDNLKLMGDAFWVPPHKAACSYNGVFSFPYVDGRLFVRGGDGISCYDLRKPKGVSRQRRPSSKIEEMKGFHLKTIGNAFRIYGLDKLSKQTIQIWDIRGRCIETISTTKTAAGAISIPMDSPGKYIVRISGEKDAVISSVIVR